MNKPFFTIIIPTYNRADFIQKTIESILNQSFKNFELIVIDDGSSDNTQDLISQIKDDRIKYFYKENGERGAARNYGAAIAIGTYINFFDSDDIAYKNHLEVAYDYINKNQPEVFHLDFDIQNLNEKVKSKLKPKDNLNQLMIKGNPLSCNGVFLSKSLLSKFTFNEDRALSGSEDYELWIRIAAQYKIHNIPIVTSNIIDHDDRSVFTMVKEKLIKRKLLMLEFAFKDKHVKEVYGAYKKKMYAYAYSYISLHIALTGKDKAIAFKYLMKSLSNYPLSFFEKRNLAIIKHLILSK